jgi:hypothetical protein
MVRRNWFQAVVVILMAVIIALLLFQFMHKEKPEEDALSRSVKAQMGQLDGKSEAEIQAELNRVIEEGMFHISINTMPVFANGTAEGNLEIENVPGNRYDMVVQITLDDTGEQIYDSGLIEPNYHIQRDRLSVELAEGEYPATATFYAYDPETMEQIGNVAGQLTVIVRN